MIENRLVCDKCKEDIFYAELTIMRHHDENMHLCKNCTAGFTQWMRTAPEYKLSFSAAVEAMVLDESYCECEDGSVFRYNCKMGAFQRLTDKAKDMWSIENPPECMRGWRWKTVRVLTPVRDLDPIFGNDE